MYLQEEEKEEEAVFCSRITDPPKLIFSAPSPL